MYFNKNKVGAGMSEHYFSEKPQSKSEPTTWDYQLRGTVYTFTSDIGVFSKDQVDFGTQLLIESFREPVIQGDILDMGCGYGPIGISLASNFPDRKIVMADVNERAVALTKKNALKNQVDNIVVIESDLFSRLNDASFAAILTNPPIRAGKQTVHRIFEESKKTLLPQGELWVVIQKKQGAPSAKKKLTSLFKTVDIVAHRKGYYIFRAVK